MENLTTLQKEQVGLKIIEMLGGFEKREYYFESSVFEELNNKFNELYRLGVIEYTRGYTKFDGEPKDYIHRLDVKFLGFRLRRFNFIYK